MYLRTPSSIYRIKETLPDGSVSQFVDESLLALLAHLGEALAAIYGTVTLGLERHAGLAAAVGADSREVLTGTAGSVLARVAAGLAALGLVLEAALRIELLLTGGEHELVSAFLAN